MRTRIRGRHHAPDQPAAVPKVPVCDESERRDQHHTIVAATRWLNSITWCSLQERQDASAAQRPPVGTAALGPASEP